MRKIPLPTTEETNATHRRAAAEVDYDGFSLHGLCIVDHRVRRSFFKTASLSVQQKILIDAIHDANWDIVFALLDHHRHTPAFLDDTIFEGLIDMISYGQWSLADLLLRKIKNLDGERRHCLELLLTHLNIARSDNNHLTIDLLNTILRQGKKIPGSPTFIAFGQFRAQLSVFDKKIICTNGISSLFAMHLLFKKNRQNTLEYVRDLLIFKILFSTEEAIAILPRLNKIPFANQHELIIMGYYNLYRRYAYIMQGKTLIEPKDAAQFIIAVYPDDLSHSAIINVETITLFIQQKNTPVIPMVESNVWLQKIAERMQHVKDDPTCFAAYRTLFLAIAEINPENPAQRQQAVLRFMNAPHALLPKTTNKDALETVDDQAGGDCVTKCIGSLFGAPSHLGFCEALVKLTR